MRAYHEDEDKQTDIYDVYPPFKKPRLNDKEEDDSSDDDEYPTLIDDSDENDALTQTNTVAITNLDVSNLEVTFFDNERVGETESVGETDIKKYRRFDSLPFPDWFMRLSWELLDVRGRLEFGHAMSTPQHSTSSTTGPASPSLAPCQWTISRTIPLLLVWERVFPSDY